MEEFNFFDEDSIHLQATQVIPDGDFFGGCSKIESNVPNELNSVLVQMETDEKKNKIDNIKAGFVETDNFVLPEIPDDDNDDFSWLFKVLPADAQHSDQTVPTGESPPFESHQVNTLIVEEPPLEVSNSLIIDTMFSAMDVTSLVSCNDDNDDVRMTFYNVEENENYLEEQKQRQQNLRKICTAKRSVLVRGGVKEMISDTPVSLRRSQRKRSYQQMIDAEVQNITNLKVDQTNNSNKRRRVQSKQSDSHHNCDPINSEIEPVKNALKIILRKHKPVNPIDKRLYTRSYKRGLIDGIKVLASELYLKQSLPPKSVPILDESFRLLMAEKPLNPKEIMILLRKEWIENHNAIANANAHGQEVLGSIKLTSNGKFIRGRFVTIDLGQQYETLLCNQNNVQSVINWKKQKLSQNTTVSSELNSSSYNKFDNTFSNFSNFDTYFNDDDDNDTHLKDGSFYNGKEKNRKQGFNGIVGAVPVHKLKVASNKLPNNWPIFLLKGQLYRPNPVVVSLQRIPDNVIKEINSKPKKITLQSTYYNTLASYFKKRSQT